MVYHTFNLQLYSCVYQPTYNLGGHIACLYIYMGFLAHGLFSPFTNHARVAPKLPRPHGLRYEGRVLTRTEELAILEQFNPKSLKADGRTGAISGPDIR